MLQCLCRPTLGTQGLSFSYRSGSQLILLSRSIHNQLLVSVGRFVARLFQIAPFVRNHVIGYSNVMAKGTAHVHVSGIDSISKETVRRRPNSAENTFNRRRGYAGKVPELEASGDAEPSLKGLMASTGKQRQRRGMLTSAPRRFEMRMQGLPESWGSSWALLRASR